MSKSDRVSKLRPSVTYDELVTVVSALHYTYPDSDAYRNLSVYLATVDAKRMVTGASSGVSLAATFRGSDPSDTSRNTAPTPAPAPALSPTAPYPVNLLPPEIRELKQDIYGVLCMQNPSFLSLTDLEQAVLIDRHIAEHKPSVDTKYLPLAVSGGTATNSAPALLHPDAKQAGFRRAISTMSPDSLDLNDI